MSRIKSYLLGFIALCMTITAFGQDQILPPKDCVTLPAGQSPNADFSINPQTGCLTDANRATGAQVQIKDAVSPTGASLTGGSASARFNFNYRNIDPPDGHVYFLPGSSTPNHIYEKPGTYWIVMNGVLGSTSYLTCKSVEIINTHKLDLKYDFCNPNDVTVLILDTPTNKEQPKILIEWGDGNTETINITSFPQTITHHFVVAPTATSPKPKIQGLYVRGGQNACPSDALNLDVAPIAVPRIMALEGLAGGAQQKLTFTGGTPDEEFTIEMKPKGGAWTSTGKTVKLANTTGATATETITVPNATGEYCFRLQKSGLCGSSNTSEPVCTINATNQVLSSTSVKIDWTSESYPAITRYQVVERETPANINQNAAEVTPSANPTYTFDAMDCSTKYEFWVVGIYGFGASRVEIKSAPFIVEPLKSEKIPFANLLFVSLAPDVNLVKISTLTQFPETIIYRAEGNSTDFQEVMTIKNTTVWEDKNVEINKQQYCYKAAYKDKCDNISDQSTAVCTVFLTSAQPNTLNWTPFTVSDPTNLLQNVEETQYYIQLIDSFGVLQDIDITSNTEADVKAALDKYLEDATDGKVTFRILARQKSDLFWEGSVISFPFSTYSNTYTFITPAVLYIPMAFSPNDDTWNDVFKANGKFIAEFNMVIYNRWGNPIFESTDMEIGWDGKDNGVPAPQGNYSYKIYGIDKAGQAFNRVGSILLLK